LGIATVLWIIVSRILVTGHSAAVGRPAHEFVMRTLAAQLAVVPAIVAGCLLLAGSLSGLWWQAAATLFCIVAGVADAWVLLVEILR
jgi:hypothetical protein